MAHERRSSRRRFLATAATLGAVGLVGVQPVAANQTTIRLLGRTSGWVGQEPSGIQGETNPTLDLEVGTDYEFVWENGDGVQHNLQIRDSGGGVLHETERMSTAGETRSFTATGAEEWADYNCVVHPSAMQGAIDLGGGMTDGTETTTTEDGSGGEADGSGGIPGFGVGAGLLGLGGAALARRLRRGE